MNWIKRWKQKRKMKKEIELALDKWGYGQDIGLVIQNGENGDKPPKN